MPRPRPAQLDSPLVPRLIRAMSRASVAAYRATDGRVGGNWRLHSGFPRAYPVCLLTTRGRKTGRRRTTPLLYLRDDDRFVIVASRGGGPRHPMWYRNIVEDPTVVVQTGGRLCRMRARVADDEERTKLWPRLVEFYPDFEDYQSWTDRTLPIVVCEPVRR